MAFEVSKIWAEWQSVITSLLMSELPDTLLTTSAPIQVEARSVAFLAASSFAEFADNLSAQGPLLRQRMREIRIYPADQRFFSEYSDVLNLVAIVNDSIPELTAMLPVWARIASLCLQANLRVVTEEGASAMLERLLNGEADIDFENMELPQLVFFDEDWQLQGQWGPRPQAMEPLLDDWLAIHPEYEQLFESDDPVAQQRFVQLNDLLRLEMRVWCNSGLDRECAHEIRDLLATLQEEDEPTNEV